MELYMHYPFCVHKCRYCDFLSALADDQKRHIYIEALQNELRTLSTFCRDKKVTSIFIGGGTPSLMQPAELENLIGTVRKNFQIAADCEITLEANPGTLTLEKLRAFKKVGINRLSLGLQSSDDRELAYLGRIHRYADFLESFSLARQEGFQNINVDLMSALPGQTLSSWEQTLHTVASLKPEHISAYSLIIEEGTPFYEWYGPQAEWQEEKMSSCSESRASLAALQDSLPLQEILPLPDEDTERCMYERTQEILATYGFHRYEISNYAKEGYECRHNVGYWRREEYLGLGLGAASLMGDWRFQNTKTLEEYLKFWSEENYLKFQGEEEYLKCCGDKDDLKFWSESKKGRGGSQPVGRTDSDMEGRGQKETALRLVQEKESRWQTEAGIQNRELAFYGCHQDQELLSVQEQMSEFMFLGLRLTKGILDRDFVECFGKSFLEVYGEAIRTHCENGLLVYEQDTGRLYLTKRGIDLSNYVLSDFV